MLKTLRHCVLIGLAVQAVAGSPATANDYEAEIRKLFEERLSGWLRDPVLVEAVKRRNEQRGSLTPGAIEALDQEWREQAKAGAGSLLNELLNDQASLYLRQKKDGSEGLITEVFAMDGKGLNVALSDVTSDYMQGDEAKWAKTYGVGPGALFVDEVEFDDSTNTFQCQLSATIVDPTDGKAIGAITFGINVEKLS